MTVVKQARDNKKYRDLSHALRRRAKAENLPCWICGNHFNWELPWHDAGGFTADHVDPIALGGKPRGELRPAHRGCNSRRGTGQQDRVLSVTAPVTSRPW